MAAYGYMAYLGALPFVIDGFFDEAVKRLREEWTSLPGAKESGWAGGMEQARAYFVARGGRLASKGQG